MVAAIGLRASRFRPTSLLGYMRQASEIRKINCSPRQPSNRRSSARVHEARKPMAATIMCIPAVFIACLFLAGMPRGL